MPRRAAIRGHSRTTTTEARCRSGGVQRLITMVPKLRMRVRFPSSAPHHYLATLVPAARHTIAARSGHDIYQDEPVLVVESIRQVVAGVRNADTWSGLTSCCAK